MDSELVDNFFPPWISTLRCVSLVFLLFARAPVQGQPQMIGSAQPIVAVIGDDVILPCHLEPRYNVKGHTVEWSRPDLKLDPGDRLKKKYVHLYREGRELLAMKNPLYFGRTVLFRDGLKHGNISLKLANVTLADQGKYRCFIPKLNSQMKESVIQLIVEPLPQNTTSNTTEEPWDPVDPDQKEETDVDGELSSWRAVTAAVVCSVLMMMMIVGGFFLIRLKRTNQRRGLKNHKLSSKQNDTLVEALAG